MLKKSANSGYCGNFECSGYYYSGVQIYCKVEYLFHKFMYALDLALDYHTFKNFTFKSTIVKTPAMFCFLFSVHCDLVHSIHH